MNPRILTLTTDFGTDGPYVASIKGIVLGLAPGTQLVDVSHQIAPQNILEGAFVLASVLDSFPQGTVHLAVIDPGVGTSRKLKAVEVAGQWLLGPDNGLLGGVCRHRSIEGIWEISNPSIRRPLVSNTFHGRDILAPAAAYLLCGGHADVLGPRCVTVQELEVLSPQMQGSEIIAEVVYRDRFGNLITNVRSEQLAGRPPGDWSVQVSGVTIAGLVRTYGERSAGELVTLAGSTGWMEIAQVNGDAGQALDAGPGTTVWFRCAEER